jgi:glycosyltransferase involved in cell wall biosynthesis
MKMISIIIPTLNEAKYLERVLKSIRNQNSQALEIIIVDGGSTDNTLEIAKKYADAIPIKIAIKKSNIAQARNSGAKLAKGEILIFLDADSTIAPNFIMKCKEIFSNKKIAAVYGKMIPFDEEKTLKFQFLAFIGYRIVPKLSLLLRNPIFPGACMVVRKSAFESINGFREDLDTSEDIDLYRRLFKHGIAQSDELIFSTSMRRFNAGGMHRWIFKWIANYFYYLLTGKTSLKKEDYEIIR